MKIDAATLISSFLGESYSEVSVCKRVKERERKNRDKEKERHRERKRVSAQCWFNSGKHSARI